MTSSDDKGDVEMLEADNKEWDPMHSIWEVKEKVGSTDYQGEEPDNDSDLSEAGIENNDKINSENKAIQPSK